MIPLSIEYKGRCIISRFFSFILCLLLLTSSGKSLGAENLQNDELTSGCITIIDEKGSIIFQTGLIVTPGDQYISENNRRFEVTAVEGNLATARYIQNESILCPPITLFPYKLKFPSNRSSQFIIPIRMKAIFLPTENLPRQATSQLCWSAMFLING